MNVVETDLPGVLVIEPRVFSDARGFFMESYHQQRYRVAGVDLPFVQDSLSFSRKNVLRGLHFQNPFAQGKLAYVLQGEVFDVAVDVRRGSPTFGRWVSVVLSAENRRQVYIPPGFAHGFCVTSETALFAYKCSETYHPEAERAISWNDPDLAIPWPTKDPILTDRDRRAPRLRDAPAEWLVY